MATPYLQRRFDTVPSTQDLARDALEQLPILVLARHQTEGRGRTGSTWTTSPRALAASLALHVSADDSRPLSLMAGVAAARSMEGIALKWPNDLIRSEGKVGGILVERSGSTTVVGMGVNLHWPDPPEGAAGLYEQDPGEERHAELGALWGAEMMNLVDSPAWPLDEYRDRCITVGRQIYWDPAGQGLAVGVDEAGGLVVESANGRVVIQSGAVRHVRTAN